jgi:acetyl-CoA acetyltransferase
MQNRRDLNFLGKAAIAGIGYTDFSRASGKSVLALATEACRNAVEDAGLEPKDVDGIASFRFLEDSCPTQAVATALALPDAEYLLDVNLGGQAPCYLVMHAAAAIESGLASNVLVFRALNGRSGMRVGTSKLPGPATGMRYSIGLSAYPQVIAMWARRFMIETGATEEDLSAVALTQRKWAELNNRAVIRKPLTPEDYWAAPYVAEPFRVPDCTTEVDGGCAVLVTSSSEARDLRHDPATIVGAGYAVGPRSGLDMGDASVWDDQSRNFTSFIARDLWSRAGIGPADIDFAEIYDCFTSSVLFALEGLGIAERGTAGQLMASGAATPGGTLPINTHGGLLCEGYLHGMNTVAEAALQIQGRGGRRQVDGAETCVVTSGALQDGSALVLARGR